MSHSFCKLCIKLSLIFTINFIKVTLSDLRPFPYLGSAHQVFNLHVLWSCASSLYLFLLRVFSVTTQLVSIPCVCVPLQKQEVETPGAQPTDMEGDVLIQMVNKAVNAIMTRLQSEYPLVQAHVESMLMIIVAIYCNWK